MRDERLTRGIDLLNTQNFYQAHEVLEDVWRESRGPERKLLQAVIQAAVALHHHSRGNAVGARSLLTRAGRNLEGYPQTFAGMEISKLRASLSECNHALANGLAIPEFEIRLAACSSRLVGKSVTKRTVRARSDPES